MKWYSELTFENFVDCHRNRCGRVARETALESDVLVIECIGNLTRESLSRVYTHISL